MRIDAGTQFDSNETSRRRLCRSGICSAKARAFVTVLFWIVNFTNIFGALLAVEVGCPLIFQNLMGYERSTAMLAQHGACRSAAPWALFGLAWLIHALGLHADAHADVRRRDGQASR